ncbi:MAG: response regulator, partial [Defluviitaleaceae bacterium]|nr:response regulator [Defluviitaleaceae bacterium]
MDYSEKIKSSEDELNREREANPEAGFLMRMSHNVRTPVTSVLGISEILLRDTTLPAHVREAFVKIHNAGRMLLGAVNDIMDLPKIESGELALVDSVYDIAGLVSEITQLHLVNLGSRKISYKVDVCPNIPATLLGDELRIKQILDNLLANAFRFTETGSVTLKTRWKNNELIFTVTDTGLGIKADENYSDALGIPIAKSLVKLMNATIDIKTQPGIGTRITVKIPQTAGCKEFIGEETAKSLTKFHFISPSQAQIIEPEPMPYGRALVVDDVDSCLYVVKGILGFYEIDAEIAQSAAEAIEKIKQNEEYDIIFMDCIMPGMDGITATRIMREMGCAYPIVALTANAISGQEQEYLKNGFDAVMVKPINTKDLDMLLHKYVRDKQPKYVLDAIAAREKSSAPPEEEPPVTDESLPEVMTKLRADFLRRQQNVYTLITTALGENDLETALWHVDTVKNMAGMIGEPILAKIAS